MGRGAGIDRKGAGGVDKDETEKNGRHFGVFHFGSLTPFENRNTGKNILFSYQTLEFSNLSLSIKKLEKELFLQPPVSLKHAFSSHFGMTAGIHHNIDSQEGGL